MYPDNKPDNGNMPYRKNNISSCTPAAQYNNRQQNYNEQLDFMYAKTRMELSKKEEIQNQKLRYKEDCADLKIKKDAENMMVYPDICKNKDGDIMFMLNKKDSTLSGKRLLNTREYKSFLCFSTYPKIQRLLVISWNYNEHFVYFPYGNEGIKVNFFIKKLNSHGLHLLVSGRAQKEAASVLLAYSLENAKKIEIPFDYGWWKDAAGKWHFAKKNQITMKEVKKIEW